MRVCDRHNEVKAVEQIILAETDTRYDLCQECIDNIARYLGDSGRKKVEERPKRSLLSLKKDSA